MDKTIVDYWRSHGLKEKDFYCRDCGKLLINLEELKGVKFSFIDQKTGKVWLRKPDGKYYVESQQNQWVVKGRTFSGKTFFRHICWDCLFKKIPQVILERKDTSSDERNHRRWLRMVKNGSIKNLKIPKPWNSPMWYFQLVFDITDEELNKERAKFDTASLPSFIRRFGEVEGKKKFEEYQKTQAKNGNTLEYFVEKLGVEEGTKKYH